MLESVAYKVAFHRVPFRATLCRGEPGRVARDIVVVSVGSGSYVDVVFPFLGRSSLLPVPSLRVDHVQRIQLDLEPYGYTLNVKHDRCPPPAKVHLPGPKPTRPFTVAQERGKGERRRDWRMRDAEKPGAGRTEEEREQPGSER